MSPMQNPNVPTPETISTMKVVERPLYGQWIGAAVFIVLAVGFVQVLATSRNLQWGVVAQYLFNPEILRGVGITILLTVLAMIIGLIIGVVLAVMRLSSSPILQAASWGWIWFFRGVPPLVQLIFWFNLALLFPRLSIGIPFGPQWLSWNTNDVISPFMAAMLGLAFTESAYAAEMIRAGIQAVNKGQTEAASTLGMKRLQTFRRIVLPQALRIVIPPIGNDTISMLKFTSLVSVLAIPDLLFSAQVIYARTYQTVPLLVVASIWYLALTTVLTLAVHLVEDRLKDKPAKVFSRFFGRLFSFRFGTASNGAAA